MSAPNRQIGKEHDQNRIITALRQHQRQYNDDGNDDEDVGVNQAPTSLSLDPTPKTHFFNPRHKSVSTLAISDVYPFTQDSVVLVTSTLLTLNNKNTDQKAMAESINTATAKDRLSEQVLQLLSIRPYYRFSGISDDGTVLPTHCLDGYWNEDDGETSVDCGGPCNPCEEGMTCKKNSDCQSEKCKDRVCNGSGTILTAFSLAIAIIVAFILC